MFFLTTYYETQRGKIGQTQQKESEKKTYGTYRVKPTTSEYDTVETVLKYDSVKDTLKDFVEDVKQLALLSNSDKNSFKAITSKEDVDNMIKADTTTTVGESAFLSVRAFSDEDHGCICAHPTRGMQTRTKIQAFQRFSGKLSTKGL